jgi:twitching motility protein PilI
MATLDTGDTRLTDVPGGEWLPPTAALGRFRPTANSYLQGRTRQVTRARYGFRIANLGFVIQELTLSEVIERVPIYPLPNTPAWLAGIINLRGNLAPVFDLRRVFDLPPNESGSGFMLVMDKGPQAVGVPIDAVPSTLRDLRAVPDLPPLPELLTGHVARAYLLADEVWLDLDHRGLFSSLRTRISR